MGGVMSTCQLMGSSGHQWTYAVDNQAEHQMLITPQDSSSQHHRAARGGHQEKILVIYKTIKRIKYLFRYRALCRSGDKPLSESVMVLFTSAQSNMKVIDIVFISVILYERHGVSNQQYFECSSLIWESVHITAQKTSTLVITSAFCSIHWWLVDFAHKGPVI